MDLAQPMSLLSFFQPGRRDHAYQRLPDTMPIPQVEDASTHMSGSTERRGLRDREQSERSKTASHHCRLSVMDLGAWRRAKSSRNFEMNAVNGGRVECPSL